MLCVQNNEATLVSVAHEDTFYHERLYMYLILYCALKLNQATFFHWIDIWIHEST